MRIDELSDEQKTAVLAELVNMTPDVMNSGVLCVDLYDPANMALAWRVLSWAEIESGKNTRCDFHFGWMEFLPESLFECPPADAQRTWLDMILSLAIEAGMVEIDE